MFLQKKAKLILAIFSLAGFAAVMLTTSAVANDYATAKELKLMQGFPPPADKRVNKSNALMTPPYNRWSYLNMRMFYPTAGIPNADKPFHIEKSIDQGIAGLSVAKPDDNGRDSVKFVDMETYFRETYTDSLVVVKGDRIVFEKYLNGMDADQPHQMMSVTKSFAGLFGLMAVEEGKAKETDRVTQHVPELEKSGAFNGATFRQVLDMTNAMDFSEDYADPKSGIVHYGIVLGLMEPVAGETYADNIYDYLVTLAKDPEHEHGDIFHYQTPKTDVVNWVTNRVTGRSFQDDMYEKLWSKLGTDGETYVLLDKNGTLFAGGGLNATPYNLARFAMMMINDGKFEGNQIVPPATIKKLSDGGNIDAFSNGPASSGAMGNKDWSYRAQWWVRHTPGKEAFSAIGIHGQWIYLDVKRKIAIIKQSSQPVSASNYFDGYNINAYDAIIAHLTGP
jgi:CubicO group peptidase (beta-lactamase class C family)